MCKDRNDSGCDETSDRRQLSRSHSDWLNSFSQQLYSSSVPAVSLSSDRLLCINFAHKALSSRE